MEANDPERLQRYVAANVRRLREGRGLSQDQFAELVGIDLRYLQRIEAGGVNVGVVMVARLADALDVKPGLLLRKAVLRKRGRGRPARREP